MLARISSWPIPGQLTRIERWLMPQRCWATDDDTAIRRSAPFLMEKYKSYVSWGLKGLTLDPNAAPEQQFRALAAFG